MDESGSGADVTRHIEGHILRHGILSSALRVRGARTFGAAIAWVAALPYGRLARRDDYKGVYEMQRGTCSLKHALLYELAKEEGIEVGLHMGMFLMNGTQFPEIEGVLRDAQLTCVPEAHCYLIYGGARVDATRSPVARLNAQMFLAEERIESCDIVEYKVLWHKDYLAKWAASKDLETAHVWRVREACIEALRQ